MFFLLLVNEFKDVSSHPFYFRFMSEVFKHHDFIRQSEMENKHGCMNFFSTLKQSLLLFPPWTFMFFIWSTHTHTHLTADMWACSSQPESSSLHSLNHREAESFTCCLSFIHYLFIWTLSWIWTQQERVRPAGLNTLKQSKYFNKVFTLCWGGEVWALRRRRSDGNTDGGRFF